MTQPTLFDVTFDQQLKATGGQLEGHDISPNRRILGEIIFEPTGTGRIRVTARDSEHRTLWGYIASTETLEEYHRLVAVYTTLQELLGGEFGRIGALSPAAADPLDAATQALDSLQTTLNWLRASLEVKVVSMATRERAQLIARVIADADSQIMLEAGSLKGLPAR